MHYENEVHRSSEDREALNVENLKHDTVLVLLQDSNLEVILGDLRLVAVAVIHKGIFSRENVKSHEMPKIEDRKGMQDG